MAGREITVSAVIVEEDDGTFRGFCPEMGVYAEGADEGGALEGLKRAVLEEAGKRGVEGLLLRPVRCMKIKVTVG